ncbi:MAG: DUF4159 domain-containing protein [Planctomycetes bacterium]|nr:DUF4159 domain-containing protein [Planctomycetota bacterium]
MKGICDFRLPIADWKRTMKAASLVLALTPVLGALAHAATWAERAGQMNRMELSTEEATRRAAAEERERRNKIALRRIRPAMPGVDWDADPTAVPYLLYQVNKRTGLPVYTDNEGLDLASDELFDYSLIYLTSHTKWALNEREAENLRAWLKRGGTLYLDDCYNRGSPFADCVRPEVAKLIPGAEPSVLLKDDPRVADAFRMAYPCAWPGDWLTHPWLYFLLDDRPAVFFSPNDDGCAWEISTPPTASNPIGEGIGHGGDNRYREVVYQQVTNWILFAFTH